MTSELGDLLARIEPEGSFATQETASASDLALEVDGVGPIALPIVPATARKLCAVANRAAFGHKSETIVDTRVRDTWSVARSRLRIDEARWQRTLSAQLGHVARGLGLPIGTRLRAELHDLLVYGEGQFFLPHQDTEKSDAMIATLVVDLPSSFQGGEMLVRHAGKTRTFGTTWRRERERLTFTAFFADCEHEIRPVTRGYRVVLTYNLALEGAADEPATGSVELARALEAYFSTPRPARFHRDQSEKPDRFVYLLDHQYTERGLSWRRLKPPDSARVAALLVAADQVGCEAALALAQEHEIWSTAGSSFHGEPKRKDLQDLIDSDLELRHWMARGQDKAGKIALAIDRRDVASTVPTVELEPFKTEYEGYMGNYGDSSDRWYQRAAIVLWPTARNFEIQAKASAAWALAEMQSAIDPKKLADARALADRVQPFWQEVAGEEASPEFLSAALSVAVGLASVDHAAPLLRPFSLDHLRPAHAVLISSLLASHGLHWCEALFERWRRDRFDRENTSSIPELPELCGRLGESDELGVSLARTLIDRQWHSIQAQARGTIAHALPSKLVSGLSSSRRPLLEVLECTLIADLPALRGEVCTFLAAEYPLVALPHLIRAAVELYPPEALPSLGVDALIRHALDGIAARLAEPARSPDDWSILTPTGCKCELCGTLVAFLRAPARQFFEWPLAKERRRHVHSIIDARELPLTHQTLRTGSPHTLVITKTSALFEREAKKRAALARDHTWLDTLERPNRPKAKKATRSRAGVSRT